MQVSALSESNFDALKSKISSKSFSTESKENVEIREKNNLKIADRKALFESINEWKHFCQEQIAQNNIDYIA